MCQSSARRLETFREEVATVDQAIDKLDETILRSREKRAPLGILAALRRRVAGLRADLGNQRAVIHSLIGPDFFAHITSDDQQFLIETNRVFERVEDDVSGRIRGRRCLGYSAALADPAGCPVEQSSVKEARNEYLARSTCVGSPTAV